MYVLYYDKNFDYVGEEDIDVEVLLLNSMDVLFDLLIILL